MGEAGIRLGQLLKLAALVDSGGEAKQVLAEGRVTVNGAVETGAARSSSRATSSTSAVAPTR